MVEFVWERGVDHVSILKVLQINNIVNYNCLYDKYKVQRKAFMLDIVKINME